MNFGKYYKILVLSYSNIRNLRNADIVEFTKKLCGTASDVILVVLHKRS